MSRTSSGSRDSEWRTIGRCHSLLLRLMKSPATTDELRQIIDDTAELEGEHLSPTALQKRFEKDIWRLRNRFQCEIRCDRREKLYTLVNIDRAHIDLSSTALSGLAFLQATFSNPAVPGSNQISTLIDTVLMMLPARSRKAIGDEHGLLEFDLKHDRDPISEVILDKVRTACAERRQLEIDYLSPYHEDGQPRRHVTEPYRHFFNPVHGHLYLEAYSFHATSKQYGKVEQNMIHHFRMGRILNARILSKHFAPEKRRVPEEELVYELAPEIARLDVTEHIPGSQIIRHPDGSATVRAMSANLFFDLRTLLHYGPNCRVIGGDKALREMKSLVKAMYKQYQERKE